MTARNVALLIGITLVVGLAIPSISVAEMQVLESNVPGIEVGSMLSDNAKLDLRAGDRVKVLLLPSYETKVFSGSSGGAPSGSVGGTRGVPGKQN
jgi:fructose-specific phosphotransferase system IIC component